MAKIDASFLFLLLLSVLTTCSSGTLVGFSYNERRNTATSSPITTISFLKKNKVSPSKIRVFVTNPNVLGSLSNTGVYVDLFLNSTQVKNLRITWLKTHLMTFLPYVNIQSIILSGSNNNHLSKQNKYLPLLQSSLNSIHSVLRKLHLDNQVKVSVSFSSSTLKNLQRKHERDFYKISYFIKKYKSFIVIEDGIIGELSMGDRFIQLMIERARSATAILRRSNVPVVLTIKNSVVPSSIELTQFTDKISALLSNTTGISDKIVGLFAEVRREEQMFRFSTRELLDNSINMPATDFPTIPITNPSITPTNPALTPVPTDNPTPTVITVPSSSPITFTPTNPALTPVPFPDPVNSPVPITNPVTTPIGAQPVTNPVTTYPPPLGNIPVTTPISNPVMPPVTNPVMPPVMNPMMPPVTGQSWCVAKTEAIESALQAAIDYACGIGGADCLTIQQGGSCYNPNSLQSHASYAFNSYYQKNPVTTSCDFGGTAMVVNTNPSVGSCVYPASSSASVSSSSPIPLTTPPPATTASSSGAGVISYGSPPSMFNTSNPASATTTVFGSEGPPSANNPPPASVGFRPLISLCTIMVTTFVANILFMDI